MEQSLTITNWQDVLGIFAHTVLADADNAVERAQLGSISLMPHQVEAVARLERSLRKFGGALLADDTGLGKTFIALALARRTTGRTVVAAPAALRQMWIDAARRSAVPVRVISIESFGLRRDAALLPPCELLIIDEAHNLRNHKTRRYQSISAVARDSHVLLLSATPVHNSERELHSLLALFMGSRASALSARELTQIIVRRESAQLSDSGLLPVVVHGSAPVFAPQDAILDAILSLPPPVPASDGGDGGALVAFTLVRQWSSSHSAFARALTRRLTFGSALLAALENGIHPNASELRSWCASDEVIQLPLFGLLPHTAGRGRTANDTRALREAVHAHLNGVRRVIAVASEPGVAADDARAAAVRRIRESHPGEKIIAFTQFAETARTLFRRSLSWSRAGVLTASLAAIASGRLQRSELLALFAPLANGLPPAPDVRRVDLLFSTDLLSEGTNLQDASVLIHLDLPWTPVRLSQRVGRIARTGQRASQVTVYSFPPPASAESLLRMERRLAAKLSVASRSVGVSTGVLPLLHLSAPLELSAAQLDAQLRQILRRHMHEVRQYPAESIAVAAISGCSSNGFLALMQLDGSSVILCGRHADNAMQVTDCLHDVVAQLNEIENARTDAIQMCQPLDTQVSRAMSALQRWIANSSAREAAGLHSAAYARARRRLLSRIDRISSRTPTHLRPRIYQIAASARQVATNAYGSGAEHVLAELADASMGDEAWLRAVQCFGELQRLGAAGSETGTGTVLALLLLV